MREIKFRVWDNEKKKMYTDDNWDNMWFIWIDGSIWEVAEDRSDRDKCLTDRFILRQYTSLKDKNGREMYKDDIISNKYEIGIVEWNDNIGAWSWCGGEDWGMIFTEDVEIIGNIYENPELKEKTDV